MNPLKRSPSEALKHYLSLFPIIMISGPRQAGKTTFAKMELHGWNYFDMEKPADFNRVSNDISFFLDQHGYHSIIDEAQTLPQLFPVLRSYVDKNRNVKGQLILLGSVNPMLMKNVSESLAGRVGFIELTPFDFEEVKHVKNMSLNKFWLKGGYPEPLMWKDSDFWLWMESYVKTFVTRDVLHLVKTSLSPQQQIQLLTMIAHWHGKLWNASQIAGAMGLSYHTINHYLDIMEQCFLIRRLHPYYTNIGKRLTKTPKFYYRDTGILHFLLNVQNLESLAVSPYRGFSFEGWGVEELIRKYQRVRTGNVQFFFYRTATGEEIDLLVETGQGLDAYEFKASTSVSLHDISGFVKALDQLKISHGTVVYLGEGEYQLNPQITVKPLKALFV